MILFVCLQAVSSHPRPLPGLDGAGQAIGLPTEEGHPQCLGKPEAGGRHRWFSAASVAPRDSPPDPSDWVRRGEGGDARCV